MPTLIARPYQDANVTEILRHPNDSYAIEGPTGSGKSMEIVFLSALLTARQQRVLITTPQEHIEKNFTQRSYDSVERCSGTVVPVPAEMTRAARDESDGSIQGIRNFLESSSNRNETGVRPAHALVCTHMALTFFKPPTGVPANLAGYTLIVDEAHRAPALGLGQFVDAWTTNGGRVIFYSATLYRADGLPVIRPGMRLLRRPLPLHMEEGFAPSRLASLIIPIELPEPATEEEFHGEVPFDTDRAAIIITRMVQKWRADDKPKTIIRVPILSGGSAPMVSQVLDAFQDAGALTLNVSGSSQGVKDGLLSALDAERALADYESSAYDVMVGVQRVREGLDWPLCSTVYCVGLPRHPQNITQLWGRALRLKHHANYPVEHRDRAQIVFFVPTISRESFADVRTAHARSTLIVCSFLANSLCSLDWLLVKTIASGLEAAMHPTSVMLTRVASEYPYVDPELRALAEAAIADTENALRASGSATTLGQVVNMACRRYPNIARSRIIQVLIERVAAATGEDPARLRRRLAEEVKASNDNGDLKKSIERAFVIVLAEFCDTVVVPDAHVHRLHGQLLELSGRTLAEFAVKLAQLRPLRPEWLNSVVHAHREAHGTWPTVRSSGPANWPDESWEEIDKTIRQRGRQWPLVAYSSLLDFVQGYSRRGTLGQQLKSISAAIQLTDAEKALLGHMQHQLVEVGDSVLPLAELLAISGNQPDSLWACRGWHDNLSAAGSNPLLHLYLAIVWDNWREWLSAAYGDQQHQLRRRTYAAVLARYVGATLHFEVPPTSACRTADSHTRIVQFPSCASGCAEVRSNQPQSIAHLVTSFGASIFQRDPYLAPAISTDVWLTPGRRLASRPSTDPEYTRYNVNLPLDWITDITYDDIEHRRPADWRRFLARHILPTFNSAVEP